MFSLLRGMFALAIWDAPRRTLLLARDRLGQKPLIYRHDGSRLSFASELKALLALPEREFPSPRRSAGHRRVPDLRLRPPPPHDLRGREQAASGALRGLARRNAEDRPLLEPGLEPRARAADRRRRRRAPVDPARRRSRADDRRRPAGRLPLRGHRLDDHRRPDAAGVEPAGQDLRDRLSGSRLRRDPLCRAGRATPRNGAPDVHRRAEGLGDAAGPGLAVRRALRRQLGVAHVARRPRDPPRRHGRPDRRRGRRAVRRL